MASNLPIVGGQITDIGQIKPGDTLWLVYGHMSSKPRKLEVMSNAMTYTQYCTAENRISSYSNNEMGYWFAVRPDGYDFNVYWSLSDCGVYENYNHNRLFKTEEAAKLYCQICEPVRQADANNFNWPIYE